MKFFPLPSLGDCRVAGPSRSMLLLPSFLFACWMLSLLPTELSAFASSCTSPELWPGQPFVVIWNNPSFVCRRSQRFNFSAYDITANENDDFYGEDIVTFYNLGEWPKIVNDNVTINGGIPQLANLTRHLEKVQRDIEAAMPNPEFSGIGVIDMENWRPLFSHNWGPFIPYQTMSKKKVHKDHSNWTKLSQIREEAQREWESVSRIFMERTLELAEQVRPKGRWGYYLFPNCYGVCDGNIQGENNKLGWLFNRSTSLFPSIYINTNNNESKSRADVTRTIKEAIRIHAKFSRPDVPVIPFSVFQSQQMIFFPLNYLDIAIKLAADMGASGVVLWGSSGSFKPRGSCDALQSYLTNTLGPYIKKVMVDTQKCSQQLCSGHGRCIHKEYELYYQQQYQAQGANHRCKRDIWSFAGAGHRNLGSADQFQNYTCRCYGDWTGSNCSTRNHETLRNVVVDSAERNK